MQDGIVEVYLDSAGIAGELELSVQLWLQEFIVMYAPLGVQSNEQCLPWHTAGTLPAEWGEEGSFQLLLTMWLMQQQPDRQPAGRVGWKCRSFPALDESCTCDITA